MKRPFTPTHAILTLAIVFTLAGGCDKSDDPRKGQCFLTSAVISSANYTRSDQFSYSDNRISQLVTTINSSNDNTMTFEYDSNGNLTEETFGINKTIYTYNGSDELIKIEVFTQETLVDREYLFYEDGRLSKIQYAAYTDEPFTIFNGMYSVYEYADATSKNPSVMKEFNPDNSLYATHVFEYDDKKTPYSATPGFRQTLVVFTDGGRYNNILKETVTYPGVSTPTIYTSTYEYNENGYPIKSTSVSSSRPAYVREYTYNCH